MAKCDFKIIFFVSEAFGYFTLKSFINHKSINENIRKSLLVVNNCVDENSSCFTNLMQITNQNKISIATLKNNFRYKKLCKEIFTPNPTFSTFGIVPLPSNCLENEYSRSLLSKLKNTLSDKMLFVAPSDLPLYYDSDPIPETIMNKDLSSGISIFFHDVNKKSQKPFKIIFQNRLKILNNHSYLSLSDILGNDAGINLGDIITNYEYNKNKIVKELDIINVNNKRINNIIVPDLLSAEEAYLKIKGYDGSQNEAYSYVYLKNNWHKIEFQESIEAKKLNKNTLDLLKKYSNNPGNLLNIQDKGEDLTKNYLFFRCKDDWVCVKKFKCNSKKFQPTSTFFMKKNLFLNNSFLKKYKTKLFCSNDLLHLLSSKTKDNLFT